MMRIAWLARNDERDEWRFLTREPEGWEFQFIKKIVYAEVATDD